MLNPCEQCKRYIRHDETRCPFCDTPHESFEDVAEDGPRGVSRREMALLAAAAITGTGCPKKKQEPPAKPYGCVWPDPDNVTKV